MYKLEYFKVQELVSSFVYDKFGEYSLKFFDERLLITIDEVRKLLRKPVYVNDWFNGGKFQQRGLRSNIDILVKEKTMKDILYCSAHCTGKAVDFHVRGLTADAVRSKIEKNVSSLTYNIRLERDISWIHIDVRDMEKQLYYFNSDTDKKRKKLYENNIQQ